MNILETKELTYQYGTGTPFHAALDCPGGGSSWGSSGTTGSGKSTLIQMFNGLIRPTSGQVLLKGQDIWAEPKRSGRSGSRWGMVFQYPEYQLFEETVLKDIMFGPKNMGLTEEEAQERALRAAHFTGLKKELLEKSPFELSGGEKRRAAIAGVIAMDPDVLILDEPTAAWTPGAETCSWPRSPSTTGSGTTRCFWSLTAWRTSGRTADRLLVMNGGHKAMLDDTKAVFSRGEELERKGLRVPQITKIMQQLRGMGLPGGPPPP